ncbi:MAG: cytidine deaminase [Planctomycetes bacterium]|nr:cytidine deaminase [Planctomycetota bacterium]
MLEKAYTESELIIGLVGAVGTELGKVREELEARLKTIGYTVIQVKVTQDVIPLIVKSKTWPDGDEYERLMSLMDAGDEARKNSGDNSILALGAAAFINSKRTREKQDPQPQPKRAYIISALKHPEEVERLREIYPEGFYLIGVHSDPERRLAYLTTDRRISAAHAKHLIQRDEDEELEHGQKLIDTFHLSDFFLRIEGHDDRLKQSLWRILDLLFGDPYVTPTFDEYAMFLAFAASLSSADLSRQVGAVVTLGDQVVATGANDCPKAKGGRYWPQFNDVTHRIEDQKDGRDYMRGQDSNKVEKQRIINEILEGAHKAGLDRGKLDELLNASRISDLTEFGRVVHAEMDAILSCVRVGISTKGATLYATTFPCHNCAKHIIAAGISRVVFIEPYQKSMAPEFHTDSIYVGLKDAQNLPAGAMEKVCFEPFMGVGPRRFFDLFSVRLGSGYTLKRKDASGKKLDWKPEQGILRLQMLPASYLDLEIIASDMFNKARGGDRK